MRNGSLQKLKNSVYNFILENYEDEDMAKDKSETIPHKIFDLLSLINLRFSKNTIEDTTKQIHTLKHLLLYADLDGISEMCQDLENDMRKGIINHSLKDKILEEIVK